MIDIVPFVDEGLGNSSYLLDHAAIYTGSARDWSRVLERPLATG